MKQRKRHKPDWLVLVIGLFALGFGLISLLRLLIDGSLDLSTRPGGSASARPIREALPFCLGLIGIGAFFTFCGWKANEWRARAKQQPSVRRDPNTGKQIE